MAIFPQLSSISPINPIEETIQFRNIEASFGEEAQDRKKKEWDYPKRDIYLKYENIDREDALTLWNFYIARGGTWEAFKYIHPFINDYEEEFVDVCPGGLSYFLLPSVGAINYTLYQNGVPLNEGPDYIFYSQGSPDGIDYVEVYPPSQGSILTWSFTGRLVTRCRFDREIHDFETFHNLFSNMHVKLKGLLFSEQIGYATVPDIFFFDEFDDESIADEWGQTSPSHIFEGSDGKIEFDAVSARLYQNNLLLETNYFDIYTKFDSFTKSAGADAFYFMTLNWGASEFAYPYVNIGLRWANTLGVWQAYFVATNASNQSSVSSVSLGATLPDKIWVRLSYQFGDSYVRGFWTTSQPVGQDGWNEFTPSTRHCVPQSGVSYFVFRMITNSTGMKINYFRDTIKSPGPQTTTSTTTST